jgi:hypothetical protein
MAVTAARELDSEQGGGGMACRRGGGVGSGIEKIGGDKEMSRSYPP